MHENEIGTIVIDCGFQVHKTLGPGLLESVYKISLAHELESRGLHVDREKPIEIQYKDVTFEEGFRADLVVENKVIVELKSVEELHPVHGKQLLTYLRLSGCRLGYLMNFGSPLFKTGVNRVVNQIDQNIGETARG